MITFYCDKMKKEFKDPYILQFERRASMTGNIPYYIVSFRNQGTPHGISQIFFMKKGLNYMTINGQKYTYMDIVKNPDLIESLINKEKTKMILDSLP